MLLSHQVRHVTVSSPSYTENTMPGTVVSIDELSKSTSHDKNLDMWRRSPASSKLRSPFPQTHGGENTSADSTGHLPKLLQIFINEEASSMFIRFHKVEDQDSFIYNISEAKIGLDSLVYQGAKTTSGFLERRETDLLELSPTKQTAKNGIILVKSVTQFRFCYSR